jgi:hypothetical protein
VPLEPRDIILIDIIELEAHNSLLPFELPNHVQRVVVIAYLLG